MVEFVETEGIPVYVRIREALRREIAQGALKRGERLPPEHELGTMFGVSRMTLRKSIKDLIDEGLLYRRHGIGTFVAYPRMNRDHTRLTSFFDEIEGESTQACASLLALEVIPAKQRVANALDIAEGEPVIRIETLRSANSVLITLHDTHIPHKLFGRILDEDFEVQHLWTLFEKRGYKVRRAIQHIEAREATKNLARLMEIKEGSAILYKERTVFADDGTAVEFTYCYNRGDVYTLTVALER
jgi:GntR family transcriptional regulator